MTNAELINNLINENTGIIIAGIFTIVGFMVMRRRKVTA